MYLHSLYVQLHSTTGCTCHCTTLVHVTLGSVTLEQTYTVCASLHHNCMSVKMYRSDPVQVNIERVGLLAVSESENVDFDWCNTNNHLERGGVSDLEYQLHTSQTSLDKWLPVLGHLCGPSRKSYFLDTNSIFSQFHFIFLTPII